MSFSDLLGLHPAAPTVPSILPEAAKLQIQNGQLPTLQPSQLFLKGGEICHYTDQAIYEKRSVEKRRIRKNAGYSMPGLIKGTRVHVGGGNTDVVDNVRYTQVKGILYIASKRIIFVCEHDGFDRKIENLIAATPYQNCIELQFGEDTLRLFVPDGNLPYAVLRMI